MNKLTKIVATIGPATESEEVIGKLIDAGLNVARFNTKHSEPAWHAAAIEKVLKVAGEKQQPVAILLDLQGPEIRINLPNEGSFELNENEEMVFSSVTEGHDPARLAFIPQEVITALKVGNKIILADGSSELEVTIVEGTMLKAKALIPSKVAHRKTMNLPGIVLSMPSLTERDFAYLDGVPGQNIDYVGLSFVRNKQDIAILKSELEKRNIEAAIVAKIENQEALNNLDEIIEVADAIMVARGDLGVETPFQELTYWQKTIITKSRLQGKPVITATEMLKSMIDRPNPTRAEVSDVAHAIYDGTDAVMLSEETTIGKYPVKAVKTQTMIAEFNELHADMVLPKIIAHNATAAITQAAVHLLEESELGIDKVVCVTETGRTAELLARFHPHVPVHALTRSHKTYRRLCLLYGVVPHLLPESIAQISSEEDLLNVCKETNIAAQGERVLLIRGKLSWKTGFTNTVTIVEIS
jgi:pyruvate kinase